MKQQNIETSPEVFCWFSDNFPSARQGMGAMTDAVHRALSDNPVTPLFADPARAADFMLDTWRVMYRHSLASMKGKFTRGELMLFIDTHNGLMLSPQHYASNMLAVGTSDSMALDCTAEKWGVEPGEILLKIGELTKTEALCLELWANGFWYGSGQQPEDKDPAEYIKTLL